MTRRTYSEMLQYPTFEERFRYLVLSGEVGAQTFGAERFLNQSFYTSAEWRRARQICIIRDDGRDLAIPGREIFGTVYVHHLNPLTPDEVKNASYSLIDPENLICVTHETHNAIHYGDESQLTQELPERFAGDTNLW